jgi:hypothetical protein
MRTAVARSGRFDLTHWQPWSGREKECVMQIAFATDRSTTRFSLQLWSRLKGAGHLKFSFDTAINSFDEIGPALQVKGLE